MLEFRNIWCGSIAFLLTQYFKTLNKSSFYRQITKEVWPKEAGWKQFRTREVFAWSNLELPFHCAFQFHIIGLIGCQTGSLGEQVGHEICICLRFFWSIESFTSKYIHQRTHPQPWGRCYTPKIHVQSLCLCQRQLRMHVDSLCLGSAGALGFKFKGYQHSSCYSLLLLQKSYSVQQLSLLQL